MAFETSKQKADRWTKSSSFNIVDCIESENKLVFRGKECNNISFWVTIQENKSDWLLTNNDESDEDEDYDEEDYDDDDADMGYYMQEDEDAVKTKLPESDDEETAKQFFTGGGSSGAVGRLIKDMKSIKSSEGKFGVEGGPRGDNLFIWDVKLTDFPKDTLLGKDLKEYAKTFKEEPVVTMEMKFPKEYPMTPPFVRVVKPRFKFLTGHVTIGGSVCMEMLTRSGWRPTNEIESILVQIRAEIMSDNKTRLEQPITNKTYNEQEAKVAFQRMVAKYGWNK